MSRFLRLKSFAESYSRLLNVYRRVHQENRNQFFRLIAYFTNLVRHYIEVIVRLLQMNKAVERNNWKVVWMKNKNDKMRLSLSEWMLIYFQWIFVVVEKKKKCKHIVAINTCNSFILILVRYNCSQFSIQPRDRRNSPNRQLRNKTMSQIQPSLLTSRNSRSSAKLRKNPTAGKQKTTDCIHRAIFLIEHAIQGRKEE